MSRINKDGFNINGHVYLFTKGHYKVKVSRIEALQRIFGKIYIIDQQNISEADVAYHMLNIAMDHIENDRHKIIELISNLDSEHWRYKMYKYKNYAEACVSQCSSIISGTKVTEIKGKLPEADYSLFFTKDELAIPESF